jgi:quercetin dioxygenase-like cupin family protein
MSAVATPQARVVTTTEALWFLGTIVRMKLDGADTGGRFALWEGTLPHGAAPPLHSHPQDETFYVLDGEVTVWVPDAARIEEGDWVAECGQACGPGAAAFAPGGAPHTFRVESDTARMLFLSTPAGIDDFVLGLAEPAQWPWLQPPPDGPRVPAERQAAVERETGMVKHGPPPPTAA